jgi:hypothetical protein
VVVRRDVEGFAPSVSVQLDGDPATTSWTAHATDTAGALREVGEHLATRQARAAERGTTRAPNTSEHFFTHTFDKIND